MTMSKQIDTGKTVSIKDENGQRVTGTVHSYGQANDGTGRHGYWVAVDGNTYWRTPSEVLR